MNWSLTEYNSGVKLANKGHDVILKLGDGDAHLNSIYAPISILRIKQLIDIFYTVTTLSGKPKFVSMDGCAPANFSPMICKNTALDGRWYVAGDPKTACVVLQTALDQGSKLHYLMPLLPAYWQDVNGKQSASGFKKGVAEAKILEIVFGGKFRGHGIQVTGGRVKIQLDVQIQ